MYLYNSATHKKERFVPNDPNLVKMYTCGPTVYHYAHIGNLRSYIMEDVLEKGYAYIAGGNVYFDTSKLEKYYIFNDHDEEDLAVGVREGV